MTIKPGSVPLVPVSWPKAHRIIRSIHPPIDLFEDLAEPEDWEALVSAEAKTNPRVLDGVGELSLVPVDRRVSGPGASYVMAPFVHVSRDRPGRFTDGSYGVYSAGDSEEVAIREVAYHHGRTMLATSEEPGWTSQFRQLVGKLDTKLHDVSAIADVCDPGDWTVGQAIGFSLRTAGSNGVLYPSVRCPEGFCVGLFWPDVLTGPPKQGRHYDFHWNGEIVDRIRRREDGQIFSLV